MNSEKNHEQADCRHCQHQHMNCRDLGEPCERFERYGEFLARELAFVDRQFFLHQFAGMGLALGLGFAMTWVLARLG